MRVLAVKALLDERRIPYAACPTFGDSKSALQNLRLVEWDRGSPEWKKQQEEIAAAEAEKAAITDESAAPSGADPVLAAA